MQTATHWPKASQVSPVEHVPQDPPQPSAPQVLPTQSGVHSGTHWPNGSHNAPVEHVPQDPPQPSAPQSLPAQSGVQVEPH